MDHPSRRLFMAATAATVALPAFGRSPIAKDIVNPLVRQRADARSRSRMAGIT
jgi:hypothetical protein